ncbi:hypothetical protein NPIL_300421 [Nephila pilipes]|uniref:Uncharacterized protein n=1 Tax=Nephila pilipes TaxID=299642 RepID=A0A8X6QT95_NEPPI|nr:hypothetical protein NPIL_300421 [Nephila pilipes]
MAQRQIYLDATQSAERNALRFASRRLQLTFSSREGNAWRAKNLLVSGLFSVESVRPQRKDLPTMLKSSSLDKLQRVETRFLPKEGVVTIKWMDIKLSLCKLLRIQVIQQL